MESLRKLATIDGLSPTPETKAVICHWGPRKNETEIGIGIGIKIGIVNRADKQISDSKSEVAV